MAVEVAPPSCDRLVVLVSLQRWEKYYKLSVELTVKNVFQQ